jgi:hypothetical protein
MKSIEKVTEAPKNLTPAQYAPMTKEEKERIKGENEMKLRALWEKDKEMVRGVFRYHECPGAQFEFSFHKYKWDPLMTYHLKDGEVYEIPRAVAKHLNTNCAYPSYIYKNDINGQPVTTLSEKVRRTSFQSLDYIDMEDPSIKVKVGTRAPGSYMNVAA